MPKTIDHDPREPNRKALIIIGAITATITLAIGVSISIGLRSVIGFVPEAILNVAFGVMVGGCAGFYIGQWDGRRHRTPGKD